MSTDLLSLYSNLNPVICYRSLRFVAVVILLYFAQSDSHLALVVVYSLMCSQSKSLIYLFRINIILALAARYLSLFSIFSSCQAACFPKPGLGKVLTINMAKPFVKLSVDVGVARDNVDRNVNSEESSLIIPIYSTSVYSIIQSIPFLINQYFNCSNHIRQFSRVRIGTGCLKLSLDMFILLIGRQEGLVK